MLIDDRVTLAESSVICQYLDDRYPEELSCRAPINQHREALRGAGAPILSEIDGTATPRRGILKI